MSDPIVSFDEAAMRGELKELVRRTVEDTLNALLEEEADDLIGAYQVVGLLLEKGVQGVLDCSSDELLELAAHGGLVE